MTPEQRKVWDAAYGPKNQKMLSANLSPKEMTSWRYQRYIKDYLRCINAVDENVGRILDYLEKNNFMENTVIVYSSDQSFNLGEHGWYDKRWMFEESLRMPLIVKWPGKMAPGTRYKQLVQNIDYAPTFCKIAGITPPTQMQGKSMKTIIDNPKIAWREGIYYDYYEYTQCTATRRCTYRSAQVY
jgi:arylsulfatase A-like enzyme